MAACNHTREFTCCHCGSIFTGRKKKFCSVLCREHAKRIKASGRLPTDPQECQHCGTEFAGRKRKYCRDACTVAARDARDAQKRAKRRKSASCSQCRSPLPPRRLKYCSDTCADQAESECRNFQVERIRTDTNKGRCGPPTKTQWERSARRSVRLKYRGITQAYPDSLIKRNATDAWRYWIKEKAPDGWMERYYSALGKPWLNPRLSSAQSYKLRYQIDNEFSLHERMRRQITKARKRDGVGDAIRSAINRKGRSRSVERLLGYSIDVLMRHLEMQFTKGMSWERFSAGEIHIDHITPQALFDLTDDKQWKACWCLSNLRPCWASENIKKSDIKLFLI